MTAKAREHDTCWDGVSSMHTNGVSKAHPHQWGRNKHACFCSLRARRDVIPRAQVTRSVDATRPKRVYLVAPAVRDLLLADGKGQLKVMSTGVKTFERQDSKVGARADACSGNVAHLNRKHARAVVVSNLQ